MDKLDYLLLSINNGDYLHRKWLLTMFGIAGPESTYEVTDNCRIEAGTVYVKVDGAEVAVTGGVIGSALFGTDVAVDIKQGMLSGFVDRNCTTTYGVFLINAIMLYYPYAGIVKYQNKPLNDKALNTIAYDLLQSGQVDVDTHLKFENAANYTNCLAPVSVPSATRKSMVPNPAIEKRRDELFKKHKDNINDPVVAAAIQDELAAMDEANLKGDDSADFFISSKAYSTKRIKSIGMYGVEKDIRDETKIVTIQQNIGEGWDMDNFPEMVNAQRNGTFGRGSNTALGGAATKVITRIFQNYNVAGDDCGSVNGLTFVMTKDVVDGFKGRYLVGQSTPLTLDKLKALDGKRVSIRSPMYCTQSGTDICKVCVGEAIAEGGLGLNAQAVRATSALMLLYMAAAHTTSVSVEKFDVTRRLS